MRIEVCVPKELNHTLRAYCGSEGRRLYQKNHYKFEVLANVHLNFMYLTSQIAYCGAHGDGSGSEHRHIKTSQYSNVSPKCYNTTYPSSIIRDTRKTTRGTQRIREASNPGPNNTHPSSTSVAPMTSTLPSLEDIGSDEGEQQTIEPEYPGETAPWVQIKSVVDKACAMSFRRYSTSNTTLNKDSPNTEIACHAMLRSGVAENGVHSSHNEKPNQLNHKSH